MKPACRLSLLLLLAVLTAAAHAAAPVVTNVRSAQRAGTRLVDIYYDLAAADSTSLTVSVAVSTDGGASYLPTGASCTGAVGAGVAPGSNRKLTWDAGVDLPPQLFTAVRVSVTASDDPVPGGMAYIPPGSFVMGNAMSSSEGDSDELPTHTVYVSGFYLDKHEVTKALWDEVYQWATNNGYSFTSGTFGQGKAANHPVQTVSWYDCVKWCNARSQRERRTPAYYTDAGQTQAYRAGDVDLTAAMVKWTGNGYRLPTEAEWEKAARGGASGRRFPWGDTVTHGLANYYSSSFYAYDTSPTRGYHPTFAPSGFPYTSPVGYFAPNGYGLYDMAGNVWEWCWDWYSGSYYGTAGATTADVRGPTSGSNRVIRGGGWGNDANNLRVAGRAYSTPTDRYGIFGFRCALGQP